MTAVTDLTTEAEITTLFSTVDIQEITKYIGLDPDVDNEFQPVDVEEMILDCLHELEAIQYSIILQKAITVHFPHDAFCKVDNKIFLPYGTISAITELSFLLADGSSVVVSDLMANGIGFWGDYPAFLFSNNWKTSLPDIDLAQPFPLTVKYTAGFTQPKQVPRATRMALRLACGFHFANRGQEDMKTPEALVHHSAIDQLNNRRCMEFIT